MGAENGSYQKSINPDKLQFDMSNQKKSADDIPMWEDPISYMPWLEGEGKDIEFVSTKETDERKATAVSSGVGDHDDGLVVPSNQEQEILDFNYAVRYKARNKQSELVYPELPFEYGVHYTGQRGVEDNISPYDHRVDAHPKKQIVFDVTEHEPQQTERTYEVEYEVEGTIPLETLEYATKWSGLTAVESVTNAKDLFTSSKGDFIGPGPTTEWKRNGNYVQEIDNRSHASGILANSFYDWDSYESEFEFKPLKATGIRNDPLAKVLSSSGRLYDMPGADDDILGFIFKANANTKDYYIFVWESDDMVVSSRRAKELDGYNLNTGLLSRGYTHYSAETQYQKFTDVVNLADVGINGADYYSGMQLNSNQMSKFNSTHSNYGWGKDHYRVYKVTNGVMRQVRLKNSGHGKGWKQDWWSMNMKNSVRIRCTGKDIKIYTQSYKSGYYNEDKFELAAQLTVDDKFKKGSVGLATFSQAVQFEKIRVTRWEEFSGRTPASGWNTYSGTDTDTLSSTGSSYVEKSAKEEAKKVSGDSTPAFEVTHVSPEVKDSSKGAHTASVNGPVRVITNNPKNAGDTIKEVLKATGQVRINPDQVSPETALVVFSGAEEVFGEKLRIFKANNPDLEISDEKMKLISPDGEKDDWDYENQTLTMWMKDPEVKETTKTFTKDIYAYEGWRPAILFRDEFEGNEWSSYEVEINEDSVQSKYDKVEVKEDGVYAVTIEWYKGVYEEDISRSGSVNNEEDVFIKIPPVPEHFVHPETGDLMYHGYSDIDLLLTQLYPYTTEDVYMGFESNFEEVNTENSTLGVNQITNQKIVKTKDRAERVQVRCKPDPRIISWTSGKYTGKGKVNGREPLLGEDKGKQDMRNVSSKVVFIPEDLVEGSLQGPFISLEDDRVKADITANGNITFSSDYKDAYEWFSEWHTDWKASEHSLQIKTGEVLETPQVVDIDPKINEHYDIATSIIDGIEVKSDNPFVHVWSEQGAGENRGLKGDYYLYPNDQDAVVESFQVRGDYQSYEQKFEIKDYMLHEEYGKDVAMDLLSGAVIDKVTHNGVVMPKSDTDGWSILGEEMVFHGEWKKSGQVLVSYHTGDIENFFYLSNDVQRHPKVYVKGSPISDNQYELDGRVLLIDKELMELNDWVHIHSFEPLDMTDRAYESYLGEYQGSRIDPEIWFDWGEASPLPLNTAATPAMRAFHLKVAAEEAGVNKVNVHYKLNAEFLFPKESTVDLSNFFGEWQVFNEHPTEVGDWHGPPEEEYKEITNIRNQGARSGWYNPTHVDMEDYSFGFTVEAKKGDDDVYGAIFRFDPVTLNFYSFEWDGGGFANSGTGMNLYRNICNNPEQLGVEALSYKKTRLQNVPHNWQPYTENDPHDIYVEAYGNRIKVRVDGEWKIDFRDESNPLTKGAWGPVTWSQPDTYFWNLYMQEMIKIDEDIDSRLGIHIEKAMDQPAINERLYIKSHAAEENMKDYFADYIDEYQANFEFTDNELVATYFVEAMGEERDAYFEVNQDNETSDDTSKVVVLLRGSEGEDPLPYEIDPNNPDDPNPYVDYPEQEVDLNNGFSVQWTGYIFAPVSGSYDFNVTVNDGFRLWIDNKKLMDEWNINAFEEFNSSIYLEGNQWYPIKAQYFDSEGSALVWLRWKWPNGKLRKIDKQYLSTDTGHVLMAKVKETYPMPWSPSIHNGYYYNGADEHYLYASRKDDIVTPEGEERKVFLSSRPKQGAPVVARKNNGDYLREVFFYDENYNPTLRSRETLQGNGSHIIQLAYSHIDEHSLQVKDQDGNGIHASFDPSDSSLVFLRRQYLDDVIYVEYEIEDSFIILQNEDTENDRASILFKKDIPLSELRNVTVSYEQADQTPFYYANEVELNPIRSTNHSGFLYISENEQLDVEYIELFVSATSAKMKKGERVYVQVKAFDRHENPVPHAEIKLLSNDRTISAGRTNDNGVLTITDTIISTDDSTIIYEAQHKGLSEKALVHLYKEGRTSRSYLKLTCSKELMEVGDTDTKVIATLRGDDHEPLPGQAISFILTYNEMYQNVINATTNSKGQAIITLDGSQETRGWIEAVGSFNEGSEKRKDLLRIKVIGE